MSHPLHTAGRRARIALAVLCLAAAAPAVAHSPVKQTRPAAGAIVAHLPKTVTVTFSEPIGKVTSVKVIDKTGVNRAGTAKRNPANAMQAIVTTAGDRLGRYTVRWSIVAADGHAETGTFTFTVKR